MKKLSYLIDLLILFSFSNSFGESKFQTYLKSTNQASEVSDIKKMFQRCFVR